MALAAQGKPMREATLWTKIPHIMLQLCKGREILKYTLRQGGELVAIQVACFVRASSKRNKRSGDDASATSHSL